MLSSKRVQAEQKYFDELNIKNKQAGHVSRQDNALMSLLNLIVSHW